MKTVFHKATERGHANHGWLDAHHSFSFAQWYDPEKVHFGALRVLNDDIISPGMGFGTHPHDNMEIVTIPLEGELKHKDSTGNEEIIREGEVQIMSAGSGIYHSEFNPNHDQHTNLLQIWVFPEKRNIEPRYDQKIFDQEGRHNQWQTVVSPDGEGALWINQKAYFNISNLEKGKNLNYEFRNPEQGGYLFVIDGSIEINGQKLGKRDAVGISETGQFEIKSLENSKLLLIEVPMLELT
ncbi:pirin family protein [Persicobacter sp. CCB-QB2]|uniref:pirin family protein n=1 Tax=Persicobacter sp. CCB-QB2 TaxID=1561025 RepID=UPI0006A9A418|nr:pirin family protein [Persicobacter sp. CCB-QB2]